MNRAERILSELPLIQMRFHMDYDLDNYSWVRIMDFPLHKHNPPFTDILIKIPGDYPVVPPEHFFLDQNLPLKDHYFNDGYNELRSKNWAKYCLHLMNWKPSARILGGDNLLTVLESIKTILDKQR